MRPTLLLLVGLGGASLGFAPAPVFRGNYRDPAFVLKQLRGTWAMPRYDRNGATMISMGEVYTVKIEKDLWTFYRSHNGGPLMKSSSYTLRLDPKTTPAEIDFIGSGTYRLLGVYELKADKLKITFRITTEMDKSRVRSFTKPDPSDYLLELERKP